MCTFKTFSEKSISHICSQEDSNDDTLKRGVKSTTYFYLYKFGAKKSLFTSKLIEGKYTIVDTPYIHV